MKRIIKRRTPSGRITILEKPKKEGKRLCAKCKQPLRGIKQYTKVQLRSRVNLTQKRVSRIYGGYLCHKCLEEMLKEELIKKYMTTS